ncbi:restriction endonuclease subunit S [Dyella kyungheensis]|uniref:Restriction endonuclease subunit S n=1 Tax=Dyella kyungheensis TaxID=1242174 RepID=A0ABS2JVD4_9GAMM|nr:restriction endonuclease subunit S [Dyella kyungheensis]MBM7122985.1 restriction endonuclease subunit S [Dyella kyungheensis]
MNAQELLSSLEILGDGPAQIQQMRKVIVALAISGKLTSAGGAADPQKAWALLRKTFVAAALVGGVPRKGLDGSIDKDDLPRGFLEADRFVRLGDIARIEKGRTGIKGAKPGPFPMVVTAAARTTSEHYDFDGAAAIVPLVSSTGHGKASLHRLHYQEGKFALGTILAAIFPRDEQLVSARFLFEYLTTFKDELLVSRMIGTANVSLSVGKIAGVPVPIIDMATQRKVDELMALCDRLEMARVRREATRDQLTAASLARLDIRDSGTFPDDVRFALNSIPALTSRPDQVKQLRQAILNLAVRGKLVSQHPQDGHSSDLLAQIAKEKARQVNAGEIPGGKANIRDTRRLPNGLPESWVLIALNEVCSLVTSGSRGWAEFYADTGAGFIRSQNIKFGTLNLDDMAFVRPPSDSEGSRTKVEKGDLLIVITGAGVTNTALLDHEIAEAYVSQHVGLIRPTEKKLSRWLLMCLMANDGGRAELLERAYGAGKPGLNLENIRSLSIPLPPLAEQQRIVSKVDELMVLCDQLETSIVAGEAVRGRLLDALLCEALKPVSEISRRRSRAAVSGYVVSRLGSKRSFGRTAHMKYLYFAESRLGLSLGGRYMREAAGPLDTSIYDLEREAEVAGWYTHSSETLSSGNEKVSYKPGKALKLIATEGITVLGSMRIEMDRLLDLMGGLKTEQVEIIATLFAAWNDALIDGDDPSDDWIVKEVREHWHSRKQRFTPAELLKWLGWMRQSDIVPLGHPPRTIQQTTMELDR